jgi:hypothetical protein
MNQIRLCKSVCEEPDQPLWRGLWTTESLEAREAFEMLVEAGNECYGPGTHWIEAREAPSNDRA